MSMDKNLYGYCAHDVIDIIQKRIHELSEVDPNIVEKEDALYQLEGKFMQFFTKKQILDKIEEMIDEIIDRRKAYLAGNDYKRDITVEYFEKELNELYAFYDFFNEKY